MSGFKNSENFSARYYDFKPGHLLEKAAMSNAISNLIAYAEEPLARNRTDDLRFQGMSSISAQ